MKPYDILDAIGDVDEVYVMKAKEKRKSHKKLLITVSSLAACVIFLLIIPVVINSGNMNNTVSEPVYCSNPAIVVASNPEIDIAYENVWIYYVDGNEINREQEYLQLSPNEIFNVWKEKNGIGEEVELIKVNIDSNGKTTVSENDSSGVAMKEIGDYFIFNITISKNIENYYDQVERELLLESLKQTMTGYSIIEYDEYNLILQ